MKSPREILESLTNAAAELAAEVPSHIPHADGLRTALADLQTALNDAYEELNRSHQIVVLVGRSSVSVFSDTDESMSCMVLNWDVDRADPDDPRLSEVHWSRVPSSSHKVLADHEACRVDPVLVGDVVRMFDEKYSKALAKLKNLKGFNRDA